MITTQQISTQDPRYQQERELRNEVLLRPIGVPDHAWEMHDEKSWHFIALDKDEVIGCVVLVPLSTNTAQLIQMAVKSSYQGQGVGKQLIDILMEFSTGEGITIIECHARKNSIQFYTKLGFEVYGETFEEVGIPHRYMRRKI